MQPIHVKLEYVIICHSMSRLHITSHHMHQTSRIYRCFFVGSNMFLFKRGTNIGDSYTVHGTWSTLVIWATCLIGDNFLYRNMFDIHWLRYSTLVHDLQSLRDLRDRHRSVKLGLWNIYNHNHIYIYICTYMYIQDSTFVYISLYQ